MNDDQPLPLEHLRTEMPLTEFDFAAVRARVRSENARRERRAWVSIFRWAAAMLVIVLALQVKEPAPRGAVAASATETRVIPPRGTVPAPEAGAAPLVVAAKVTRRKKSHHPYRHTPTPEAVSRIEIHTADPDIRIIWIVPKENS